MTTIDSEVPPESTPRRVWSVIVETYDEWDKDNAPSLAASLAYYAAFALAPTLVVLIAVLGAIVGRGHARDEVLRRAAEVLGSDAGPAVGMLLDAAQKRGTSIPATIVSIIVTLVTVTSLFSELQRTLDAVWNLPPKRTSGVLAVLRERGFAFAMCLTVGVVLMALMGANAFFSAVSSVLGVPSPHAIIRQVVGIVGFFVVSAGLFALLYKFVPRVTVAVRHVLVGAALTALLFTLGKIILGLYFEKAAFASSYGAAGSFAVLLAWIYYSAQIFLFGAELTQVIARRDGDQSLKAAQEAKDQPPSPDGQ